MMLVVVVTVAMVAVSLAVATVAATMAVVIVSAIVGLVVVVAIPVVIVGGHHGGSDHGGYCGRGNHSHIRSVVVEASSTIVEAVLPLLRHGGESVTVVGEVSRMASRLLQMLSRHPSYSCSLDL
jgi:hypothetical protein